MNWVTLEISGPTGVKFMNICAHRNIPVKDVQRVSDNLYKVKIPIREFRKNGKHIARKAGCKVHVVKRSGMGITLYKYRKRLVVWIGIPFLLFCVFYFNSVIWQIDIRGGDSQTRAATRNILSEMNIRPGSFFVSFDNRELADDLLIRQQDCLCWVGVHRKGTVLEIELASGKFYDGDPKIPLETACNIVAGKSGVITKILTTAGVDMVKVGDVVKENQVLISGTVVLDDEIITGRPQVKTHAIGEVYAIVTYTRKVPVETSVEQRVMTGNIKKEYVLYLPGFSLKQPFFKGTDFKEYDVIYKDSFLKGPFGVREISYVETESVLKKFTEEEAVIYAEEKAVSMINDDISDDAVVLNTSISVSDGYVVATTECVENIGVLSPIDE